jgi:UDP-N-acetylmuramate dehydrogenase
MGGKGELVEVFSIEELEEEVRYAKEVGRTPIILGEGTNTYFGESLSNFLFVRMRLRGIRIKEDDETVTLSIGAGEIWDEIVKLAVDKEWWGIENLSHIPGTVGAAPVQNIGAYGAELSNVFVSLDAFDMETMEKKTMTMEDCRFGYRDSVFKYEKGRYAICSVTIRLSKRRIPLLEYKPLDTLSVDTVTIREVRELVTRTRAAKLPDWREYPNAGSFFKNAVIDLSVAEFLKPLYPDMPLIQVPEGYKVPTAWLVEHVAEMKGVREGDIGTWPQQPLVIVNHGNATADEIDMFAGKVREKINKKTGIVLEQEVNRVG